jgi:hypothetical protein
MKIEEKKEIWEQPSLVILNINKTAGGDGCSTESEFGNETDCS